MFYYGFGAFLSQVITALLWMFIVIAGENSADVRGIGAYLVLTCGVPLIIHAVTNLIICRVLKNRPFKIVYLSAVCSYIAIFAVYLEILRSPNGQYFSQGTIFFFSFSLIPMTCNILLFWFLGIKHNDFFEGCQIQRVCASAN